MTQLIETNIPLTEDELRQVKNFAEFLLARRAKPPGLGTAQSSRKYVNVDALMGLCKGMGGDKSDKELIREAWDDVIDKLDK